MSLRGLLVLLLGLAAAVALLLGLGRRKPEAAAEPASAPLVAPFEEASVREIAITCEGASLTLRRDDAEAWRIANPGDAEADPRRVRELVSALQDARAKREIEGVGANRAAFGLEPAVCVVTLAFRSGADGRTVRVGRTSPVGTDRYALPDGGRIVLTDGALYTALARRADAYRERRLVPVEADAVTRIAIERPEERLVLEQDAETWRITSPLGDRASTGACTQLARAVAGFALEAAASAQPLEARADRRIAVEITARGEARPRLAFVARAGVSGKRVAWRDGGALMGLVDESAAQELERPVDAFRDRRVVSLSSPDARWIEVRRGSDVLRIERQAEGVGWTGREGAAVVALDADRVNALLDRLRVLTAMSFGSKEPPSAPTGTVRVGGPSGTMETLSWGPWPDVGDGAGERLWVTTPSRPGVVFTVAATDFGPIPAHAKEVAPEGAPMPAGSGS